MALKNFGRYRRVSDADIARILEWHDQRMTRRQLAAQLGVSESTIGNVIRTRGAHYKTESPEIRRQRPQEFGSWKRRRRTPEKRAGR